MGILERPEPITLADVAAHAGVSKATASKALADRYGVSAATKERVRASAAALGFTPNLLARGLGGGRTQTIGMITTDLDARFAPQILVGAEDALGADRSSVIMCNSRGRPELEVHHTQELLRRSVDGLIVVSDIPEARPPIEVSTTVPVVYAYGFSTDPADTSIVCDHLDAGRQATLHLIESGKRMIALLGGPENELAARDRAAGFLVGLREAALQPAAQLLNGTWLEQWGWDATAQLLDNGIEFDGLVCANDNIARGAIDQLVLRGISVPDDVAIIGFDNWAVVCHWSRHPFSSLDMNLDQVGRAAAKALLAEGGPGPGIQRIKARVVARGSTRHVGGTASATIAQQPALATVPDR